MCGGGGMESASASEVKLNRLGATQWDEMFQLCDIDSRPGEIIFTSRDESSFQILM